MTFSPTFSKLARHSPNYNLIAHYLKISLSPCLNMLIKPYILLPLLSLGRATTMNTDAISAIQAATYQHAMTTTVTSAHVTVITLKYDEIAEDETEDPLHFIFTELQKKTATTEELTFYMPSGGSEIHWPAFDTTKTKTNLVELTVTVDESDWHKVPASAQSTFTSSVIMSMASERAASCSSNAFFLASRYLSSVLPATTSSVVASNSTSFLTSEPIATSTALSAQSFRDARDTTGITDHQLSRVIELIVSCIPSCSRVHGNLHSRSLTWHLKRRGITWLSWIISK